jgi:hypothetical protein
MMKLKHIRRYGFALLALVLLAAGGPFAASAIGLTGDPPGDPAGDPALNIPAAVDAPVPGGPGYYIGAPFEFRPRLAAMDYAFDGPRLYNRSAITSNVYFDASLHLPQGARIVRFILYYVDNDAALNVSADLFCMDLPGTSAASFTASVVSSGASVGATYAEDTTIDFPNVVDNAARGCYIRLFLPVTNNIYVNGYRVDYLFESALPIVFRSETP